MTQPTSPTSPTSGPTRLWNRHFLLWWLGGAQSAFGTALAGIATSFLILHQTGSAGAMGLNLALAMLPGVLTPLLGPLVDRWPLKPPLVLGNLVRGGLQLGLGLLALRGEVPTELIYASSFLTGLISAFYIPATMGMVARLVPATELERATGLLQGTTQTMNLLGLMGGGFLVAALGRGPSLILDGVSFVVFAALLLFVQLPARTPRTADERFWESFRAGLHYVRRSPVLMGLPLVALVLNAAFAPLEMLIPKRMLALGVGEAGYGLFFGILVAGMAAGSFVTASLGRRIDPGRASVLGIGGMGLGLLALTLTQTATQMYPLAALVGLGSAFANLGFSVLFQKRVRPDFFGRVGSLLNMVSMIGMPLTLLALAPVADRLSIATIFGVAGGVALLGALVWQGVLRRDPTPDPDGVSPS